MGRDEVDQCWRCQESWERERTRLFFEKTRLEDEVARHKRIAQWVAEKLAYLSSATLGEQSAEEWIRTAEKEVAEDMREEISPKA